MAKNRKKVHRKIAVTFLFVGRFLRSIHQKTANYPHFTIALSSRTHSCRIQALSSKNRFFGTPEVAKIAGDILPYFFLGGLIFHMRRAASESFFVWGHTTYPQVLSAHSGDSGGGFIFENFCVKNCLQLKAVYRKIGNMLLETVKVPFQNRSNFPNQSVAIFDPTFPHTFPDPKQSIRM